jgi:hypothetical protein
MANQKTYKITCTNANTAYNVVTGTTSPPTNTNFTPANKGRGITFQCQTNGALGFYGGSDVVSNAGIATTGPDGAYQPSGGGPGSSGFQACDWWVASDTAGAIIVVQLTKGI